MEKVKFHTQKSYGCFWAAIFLCVRHNHNLPTRFKPGKKVKLECLNIINPFWAILVAGNPETGKSYFVIRHIITQHINQRFTMFVYDFQYDDLSWIAYSYTMTSWLPRQKETCSLPKMGQSAVWVLIIMENLGVMD